MGTEKFIPVKALVPSGKRAGMPRKCPDFAAGGIPVGCGEDNITDPDFCIKVRQGAGKGCSAVNVLAAFDVAVYQPEHFIYTPAGAWGRELHG